MFNFLIRVSSSSILLLSALSTFLLLGCGGAPKADYGKVDLVRVTGKVTLDGSPLVGAVVKFEDVFDDTFSYAVTNANGEYVLQFDSDKEGVKVGKKVVRITTSTSVVGANVNASEEGGDPDAKRSRHVHPSVEQIPAQYNSDSNLLREVSRDKKRFDFALMRE